jgi:hypothetical protein
MQHHRRNLTVIFWVIIIVLTVVMMACTTPEPPITVAHDTVLPKSELPVAVAAKPSVTPVAPSSSDPAPVIASANPSAADPVSTDPAIQEPGPSPSLAPIQVSKEVFNQTFTEVELLIKTLNNLIKARDYLGWTKYLSKDYTAQMSKLDYLRQLNQSAMLQRNNIVLKSLQDYFLNVVVPSRANLRLDDLVFLSENVVEAIMIVGNRRVTVYRLIKVDNQWMIGLS